ncbi:MAG: rhamnogalacturonan lyase [Bacillota bacterium]
MEYELKRGLVAVKSKQGVLVKWRLLGTESLSTSFNIYRDGKKINHKPINDSTNYLDPEGKIDSTYQLKVVKEGQEKSASEIKKVWQNNYLSLPLKKPAGGKTPDGEEYTYSANDASIGDLDGDGEYEIVLKWSPSNAHDNAHHGYTGETILDAYRLDGTHLWRINLGPNIRAGAHYTQFMVYDLDGDGKAEVAVKTADGTVDGQGKVIGDSQADYRNQQGRILEGPEFLTIFSGEDGSELVTDDYDPPRGQVSEWGDDYGNRVDRFLACVAYLDGKRPSLVMCRGYYTRTVLVAYNWRDGELKKLWKFDSAEYDNPDYEGMGNHQLSVADVDGDGKDEIIYGAMTIDNDGTVLYSTGLGHGDALHVGDFDPERFGLEVLGIHEEAPHPTGINVRAAESGEVFWGIPTDRDVGRGVAANIDPGYPGAQVWAAGSPLYDIKGNVISNKGITSVNFALWWDGDLQRELLDDNKIDKWDPQKEGLVNLLTAEQCSSNNYTKATPCLQADIFGDWREEVIWKTKDSKQLRIYTTTEPTEHRFHTFMHNRMYRLAVAWQNVAYNQPPHPDFYIGQEMEKTDFNFGQAWQVLQEYENLFED